MRTSSAPGMLELSESSPRGSELGPFVFVKSAADSAPVHSGMHESGEHLFYLNRTLYSEDEPGDEEYLSRFLRDRTNFLLSLTGEFALFYFNRGTSEFFGATDRFGKELLFWSFSGRKLVATQSFWKAVEAIAPAASDISFQVVKEIVIHNAPLDASTTVIEGLRILPPGSYIAGHWGERGPLQAKKYWRMQFTEDHSLTMSDVVEGIDAHFSETHRTLSAKYPPDTRYGLGLSGGLDSRLVGKYAVKEGLQLVPYCAGRAATRLGLPSYSRVLTRRLSHAIGSPEPKYLDLGAVPVGRRFVDEIHLAPIRPSNIEVSCLPELPEFDVLLTGEQGGEIFGGEYYWGDLLEFNRSTLPDYLLGRRFLSFPRLKDQILSPEEEQQCRAKVESFIASLPDAEPERIPAHFLFEIYASRQKRGFFESNYGLKTRYTPFLDPRFFDFFLTWPANFTKERVAQKAFFRSRFPDLGSIPDEASDAPLLKRHNRPSLQRLLYAKAIRYYGAPLARHRWLVEEKEFRSICRRVLEFSSDTLTEVFPKFDAEVFSRRNPRAYATLIKLLIVVKMIQDGGAADPRSGVEQVVGISAGAGQDA